MPSKEIMIHLNPTGHIECIKMKNGERRVEHENRTIEDHSYPSIIIPNAACTHMLLQPAIHYSPQLLEKIERAR